MSSPVSVVCCILFYCCYQYRVWYGNFCGIGCKSENPDMRLAVVLPFVPTEGSKSGVLLREKGAEFRAWSWTNTVTFV